MKPELTQDQVRDALAYCDLTGMFFWRKNVSNVKAGAPAGTLTKNGYLVIRLNKKLHLAHRLAWLYHFGSPLPKMIDHINGRKTDNRIENLRPTTKILNGQNRHKAQENNLSSGMLGVAYISHVNKFTAYINVNGKRRYLGLFDRKEDAHEAYLEEKRIVHAACTI